MSDDEGLADDSFAGGDKHSALSSYNLGSFGHRYRLVGRNRTGALCKGSA